MSRRAVRLWLLSFCAIVAFACPSAVRAQEPAAADADEFAKGKLLVATKCIECHSLQRVFQANYTRASWLDAFQRMKDQGLEISEPEENEAVAYLLSVYEHHKGWEAIGQLHFVFVHFPIALILTAGFLEFLILLRRQVPTIDAAHWVVRLAAFFAVPTIILGLCLVSEKATYPPGVVLHRNLGLGTGLFILIAWFLRERSVRRPGMRTVWAYRAFLLLAMVFVGATGHLGGVLVHGDYVSQWMQPITG